MGTMQASKPLRLKSKNESPRNSFLGRRRRIKQKQAAEMLSRRAYITLEPTQSYLLVKIALGQCLGDTKTKSSEVHVGF